MKLISPNLLTLAFLILFSGYTYAKNDPFAELDQNRANRDSTFEDQKSQFYAWLDAYLDQYESWREQHLQTIDAQRSQLIDLWGEGEITDQTKSVEYTDNLKTRQVIDYENNTVTISTIVDSEQDENKAKHDIPKHSVSVDDQILNFQNAEISEHSVDYSFAAEDKEKQYIIEQTMSHMNALDVQADRLVISNTGIPESYIRQRAHNKKLALLNSSEKRINLISSQYHAKRTELGLPTERKQNASPITAMDTESNNPKPANLTQVSETSDNHPEPEITSLTADKSDQDKQSKLEPAKNIELPEATTSIAENNTKTANNVKKKVVSYSIKLPPGSLLKRATQYKPLAQKESQRWNIDEALVMAIMHSESAFRPKAKSHIPAFGLMQVVPTSAGHDVNRQIRNIDAPMSVTDLYKPDMNVETGTAYLHILNNRYLKSIKDDTSRLYCVIAAYNTGAGNVARAFNPDRSTNIRKASHLINQLSPDEVYQTLVNQLPYDETKNYLKKVTSRIALYQP